MFHKLDTQFEKYDDENVNPNAKTHAKTHAKTRFERFQSIIQNSNKNNKNNIKQNLMVLFNKSTLQQLKQMYDFANSQNTDAYEDAAFMLDRVIESRKDRQLKNKLKNEDNTMQNKFNELIENATKEELMDAYKFTLYPKGHDKYGEVKPGYDDASKILDTLLENRDISRNKYGNEILPQSRNVGTPFNPLLHRPKTHKKTSHQRGGSYKKRRRPSLKKSRRVKRRKTNSTRKSRK
jgi:hypothetical protein